MSQFDKIYAKLNAINNHQLQAATVGIGTMTISKTPVRDGYLKASWNFAVGAIDSTLQQPSRNSTSALAAEVRSFKIGMTGYFVNAQPYAIKMECGGSGQAPNGMVRISISQWQYINDQIARSRK